MNCWKTIDAKKDLGTNRIYLVAALIGILSFVLLYPTLSLIHPDVKPAEAGIIPTIAAAIFLPLIHSVTHVVPFYVTGKKCKIKYSWSCFLLPNVKFRVKAEMNRIVPIISLLAPTFLITIPFFIASIFVPSLALYTLILMSINIGMSFSDYFYLYNLWKAPKRCVIAGTEKSYDILIK